MKKSGKWSWKKGFWVGIVCLGSACSGTAHAVEVWTAPSLEKTYPETRPPENPPLPAVVLETARNETEWGQIRLRAPRALQGISVAISPLVRAGTQPFVGKTALFQVGYVNVARPSIAGSRAGLYPDPLLSLEEPLDLKAERTESVWVKVFTPTDCAPGDYEGLITIRFPAGLPAVEVPLRLTVHDFALPVVPSFQSLFGMWDYFFARAFGVEEGSPACKRIAERYYWFLVERRLTPAELPVMSLNSPDIGRFLGDPRVTAFRVPIGYRTIDPNLEKQLRDALPRLRREGWLKKAIFYGVDEPAVNDYELCRQMRARCREIADDIPFLLTITRQPVPELDDHVDIWCPILNEFTGSRMAALRAKNGRIWWYTCSAPQLPYPTYLIDDSGSSHRVLSWLQALHRVEGVVYWCVNVWTPYSFRSKKYGEKITVWDGTDMFGGANGDGYLLYPGKTAEAEPISSIRLEMIRDGNEDLEYVAILRTLLIEAGESDPEPHIRDMIGPVARSLTDWTRDPRVLLEQRRAMAREIVRLKAGRKAGGKLGTVPANPANPHF